MNKAEIIFAPIESKRTFEEVSYELKKFIFQEKMKPGDRLPSELELAKQFGVGRQTIREALRVLELSGMISIKKGSGGGPVIQNTILNRIQDLFIDAFLTEKIVRDDLTSARCGIELLILDHLFEKIDRTHIQELEKNIRDAKKLSEHNMQPFLKNLEFHKILASAGGNQVFIVVMESIIGIIEGLFSKIRPSIEESKRVVHEHEAILNAITRGNRDKAKSLLEKHLHSVRERINLDPAN